MEPEPLTSSQTVSNKLVPIVVSSVLITALIVGGGVYAYQKNQSGKTQSYLQSQVSVVNALLATPISITTPKPSY